MTSSETPPSGSPPDDKDRRRPGPTIDLEATEVGGKPKWSFDWRPPWSYDWRATWSAMPMSWRPPGMPWRMIAAAVVGGVLVLAGFLVAGLGARPDSGVRGLDMRLIRVEQQIRDILERPPGAGIDPKVIAELTERVAKIEAAVAALRPSATDPALANRLSRIEGEVKAMAETLGIVGRRSDEIATVARDARAQGAANAAAIAELERKLARLGTVERSEFDAVATRIAMLERGQKAIETELAKRPPDGSTDRLGRLAVAAAALQGAIERGGPFSSELATAKALGGEPRTIVLLEPFAAAGMPTAATLGRELSEIVPALYKAAGASPREGGFLDRLQASAENLVRIRPITEIPGNDPAAVILRIEVKAARGDIAGALAELTQLPAPVRAPAEAWIKKAEARMAAVEASRQLAFNALAALGK
jgi:hypothetical protein